MKFTKSRTGWVPKGQRMTQTACLGLNSMGRTNNIWQPWQAFNAFMDGALIEGALIEEGDEGVYKRRRVRITIEIENE